MTSMRERRQQQALRLILPSDPNCALMSFPSSGSSSSLSSASSGSNSSSLGTNCISDLKKLEILGHGNGGTVYKVCHEQTGMIYALKVLHDFDKLEDVEYRQLAMSEADILTRVDTSEYIVRCLGVLDSGFEEGKGRRGDLCFVMEYMDMGSLHDILRKNKKLPENVISGIARNVLKGLQYLHGMQIVHGDIKPSNLLVNGAKGEVKLADFGASRVVINRNQADCMDSCVGTCAYMSPERMDPEKWNKDGCSGGFAGDIWSLGLVAMECYVGRFPLIKPGQKPDWVTLMCAICFEEDVKPMLRMASLEFQSFCQRCLERDWRIRGTVEELLSHPFVNNNTSSNESNGVTVSVAS
ncbi:mitogen-activated protein kinase kinase 10-like [Primulina huaijiensis]|uniref:mitogen-activated protein kinase kinase 10-like n=1 Tax=Primulina huaijiensis TaxID=1492673 RepID=UPI003CC6F83B